MVIIGWAFFKGKKDFIAMRQLEVNNHTAFASNLRQDLIIATVGCVILKQPDWPIMIAIGETISYK